jgi:signal transduction histidine kinase
MPLISCENSDKQTAFNDAIKMITDASQQKDFRRMQVLADSLGKENMLSEAESYFWQGFAYYRMAQVHTAEFYWKEAMAAIESSDDADLDTYARSASYLAGLHIRYYNFQSASQVVRNALEHLNYHHYTATSDYTNLLIFAGCCRGHFNIEDEEVPQLFEQAFQRHLEHIAKKQNRETYHDAVVGVINITYGWLSEKKYEKGLFWNQRFSKLISEYKQLFPDDSTYIDKQQARCYIFEAIGLEGIGKIHEAENAFSAFQRSNFANTDEGQLDASDYLAMSGKWHAAARILRNLDNIFIHAQSGYSLDDIQKYLLKKYRVNLMTGQLDSASVVANQICQRLDSAIIKSQWIDSDEQETIRQKEEQILQQQEHLSKARIMSLIAAIIVITVFFSVYTYFRHRAERRLAAANAQLEQKNEQLAIANAHAEESARMKTCFIQQMSHEIRTPLNILSGFTQVITTPGMELDDATRLDINSKITENTDRITSLVNKMLELSEVSSKSIIDRTDNVPIVQIASQAIDESGICNAEHLTFDLQLSPETENMYLQTNLRAATRALTLLLDNAKKFTHDAEARLQHNINGNLGEKKKVVMKVTSDHDKTVFTIEDTGIGVPPEAAERIFEEFIQLDEYYDGTGIGLTIARSLARRLGGDIHLDTSYTNGARFVMEI